MDRLRRQAKLDKMRDLRRVRRRKIVIQKLVEGEDEWGNVVSEWTDWREFWADLESLWGQEYFAARAVNEQNTGFCLRYALGSAEHDLPPALRAPLTMWIKTDAGIRMLLTRWGSEKQTQREYDIVHIDRLNDDGMWVKLRCKERGANV